jgi:pyruvate dehydrogenase E2 component (dihydrolipoamide acetyltransferase)
MAEVKEVAVPDIGDFEDVPVIEILVKEGDAVAAEDPLVTLESDKATMDVPAPFAGVVAALKVKVGDRVSEGSTILTLSPSGNGAVPAEAAVAEVVEEAGRAEDASAEEASTSTSTSTSANGDGEVYASPSVRRRARELGVDLSGVSGSGRKGRITLEDLDRPRGGGAGGGGRGGAAPASGGGGDLGLDLAPWPTPNFEKWGPVERQPRSRIAKIAAPFLARSWVNIPHVTHHEDADITDLEAFRKQVNAEQDVKLTMVALLVKACVSSLQAFEQFNSSLDGDDLVLKRYFNIGFAADTPNGLVVPVIRDADTKGLLEIGAELRELSGRAREGKLKGEEMQGGTFTISSLGGIGGTGFTPIVNAPEVAILGVTRSAMKPVWDGSAFVPRLIVPLSLSYDHRVIDGAAAARFCVHLAGVLSDFRRVLL